MPRFERIPDEGDRDRLTCLECGHVDYENPKVVIGSVVSHDGAVLLCRRAIAPRIGFWTLPAGYLELGETLAEGAMREADEEACAAIAIEGILAIYDISRIGQVQVIHRASFADRPTHAPGPESRETRMFAPEQIPWGELAFPSVEWALRTWLAGRDVPLGRPVGNPSSDPRGSTAPELSECPS